VKTIDILLQGEGIPDIQVISLGDDQRVRDVLAKAAEHRKTDCQGEFLVFVEDKDVPLHPDAPLPVGEPGKPARLHVHRCHSIAVAVTFNGEVKEHRFGPGITVETAKRWAAIKGFGMTPADAAEHVLQLAGSTIRPEPDTHIGSLVSGAACQLRFDLVPLKRVEG
jgi:hypothetical protein